MGIFAYNKILCGKMKWNKPYDMDGELDNPVVTLREHNKEGTEKYFYRNKNGDIIDPENYNRVKIARAFQGQAQINQDKWNRENTCPYCGMVLSTREAQEKECDNCGGTF